MNTRAKVIGGRLATGFACWLLTGCCNCDPPAPVEDADTTNPHCEPGVNANIESAGARTVDGLSSPSCVDSPLRCGADASESCCKQLVVPGGCVLRSYDAVNFENARFPATVRTFRMDEFEVTVSRFRRFVAAYPALELRPGQGRSKYLSGESGWRGAELPESVEELELRLACDEEATWTHEPGSEDQERLPINCVDYHLASAFCIWEKGRLPTEAEWNYAAAGGSEQRVYPWSKPSTSATISPDRAAYDAGEGEPPVLGQVGSRPGGNGRWLHADLAGNVAEWTLDYYADSYTSQWCEDCVGGAGEFELRAVRGGSYYSDPSALFAAARSNLSPEVASYDTGFRCAYELNNEGG